MHFLVDVQLPLGCQRHCLGNGSPGLWMGVTCRGASPGCVGARGWISTARGMLLCCRRSMEAGTQLSVSLMFRGLQLPMSCTMRGHSAGSGSMALPSCRVGNTWTRDLSWQVFVVWPQAPRVNYSCRCLLVEQETLGSRLQQEATCGSVG